MERIDLAHTPPFALGSLSVRPPTREVVTADGQSDIVEPRVMQVLVALARAEGGVVSRDDLTLSCWEGRVVGEDAINRVISRLRRLADGIGAGNFRLETVTKVGYRLLAEGAPSDVPRAADIRVDAEPPRQNAPARRAILGEAAATRTVLAGAGWLYRNAASTARPAPTPSLSPEVTALMVQAATAMRQADVAGNSQSIGLYKRVVALVPDYADGWGALAMAYAFALSMRPKQSTTGVKDRARAAAARALAIDPDNAYAHLALAQLEPLLGNWAAVERAARHGFADHPTQALLLIWLEFALISLGRMAEGAMWLDRAVKIEPPTPGLLFSHAESLWAANRLEEADRESAQAYALYPMHAGVWFRRFNLLMFTDHAEDAIAMGEDVATRPLGPPESAFEETLVVARAMRSRAPGDIAVVMRLMRQTAAPTGAGYAGNFIEFAAALGQIDDAFAFADAYYFNRGPAAAGAASASGHAGQLQTVDRRTPMLFFPSTRAMRADPRFGRLVTDIGLTKYWSDSHSVPDYKRGMDVRA